MGGTKRYKGEGVFDYQTFETIGTAGDDIKILKKIGGKSTTPSYSHTPYTMYAAVDEKTGKIEKVSVYMGADGRQKIKDIDLGHMHRNPDGKIFPEDKIHVQIYDENGIRSKIARYPSKKEKRIFLTTLYGRK